MNSYHDLHVTVEGMPRTSIFDMPYGYEITCNRVAGWELWETSSGEWFLVGGEYDARWLILDVAGHEIVNSRDRED